MYNLFSHSNIANMKRLLEGDGTVINAKYAREIVAFEKVFTLITCNSLCCPFEGAPSSNSGWKSQ